MANGEINATDLTEETTATLSGNEQFVMFDSAEGKRADIDEVATYIAGDKTQLQTTEKGSLVGAINEVNGKAADLKEDLSDNVEEITGKLIKIESNNYAKSDLAVTSGYITKDGTIYASDSYFYTDSIPVKEGDVIRLYTYAYGAFTLKSMRFVCAYNSSRQAVSASGAESVLTYTVPAGIDSVVLTSSGSASNVNQLMVTKNYEATEYEAYFQPYYIASEEFVEDVLNEYAPSMSTVDGHNLIKTAEDGIGAYYASGSTLKYEPSYTGYHYAIMPVEKNSRYYVSRNPRWWVLTDDNDVVLSNGTYFSPSNKKFIDTGNATKFYFTIDNGQWEEEANYGILFAIIVSKGNTGAGAPTGKKLPLWISGLTQRVSENKYALAVPNINPRFTVGISQKWYYKNCVSLDSDYVVINTEQASAEQDGYAITPSTAKNMVYQCMAFDYNLALVGEIPRMNATIFSDNISSCSMLVIGDSTVAQNHMTQGMLDAFGLRSKTLTLLGTQGTAPNNHEGRSGWKASDYCDKSTVGGITNPFYNNGFDFEYYMNNQNYGSVDFVVLQVGINDLYNAALLDSDNLITATLGYLCQMIDSILAWNANQKILVNLPTAVNSIWNDGYMYIKRNIFVRYNASALLELTKYSSNNVRATHCHLILNPQTDISDNVHPTPVGYNKMALEVVSQVNCWQNA